MSQKVDLKIAQVLAPQEWMKDSRTRSVMDALGNRALFVGGCVRNMLLGEAIGDIDLATPLTPQEVTQKLEAAGIKVVPTGIDHGTVTGVVEGKPFEITTLRRDTQTDGRRAVVAYTEDWREDAQRRDFTMNTLLADIEGNVYDPLGTGLVDLQARRVVFVGDPAARIAEDTLRILRFFRFHAFYGRGEPDAAALAACKNAADKISSLSKERITQEFFKILSVERPDLILALMFEHAVLREFETPLYDAALMQRFCDLQRYFSLPSLPARLRLLVGLDSQGSRAFEEFLIVPKAFKKEMEGVRSVLALPELTNDHAVKVAVYKFGRAAAAQALMIELAQNRVSEDSAPKALEIIQKWEIPVFPISGEDLIREGFKPGPDLGAELASREEAWIAGGF